MTRKTLRKASAEVSADASAGPSEVPLGDNEGTPLLFPDAGPRDVCEVRRLSATDAKYNIIGRLPPDETTEQRVAECAGGGRYRVMLVGPDENTGKLQYKRRLQFEIEGQARPFTFKGLGPTAGTTTEPGRATVMTTGDDGKQRIGIDEVMTAGIMNLFTTQQQVNQAMIAAVKEVKGGTTDWGKTIAAALPLVTELVKARTPVAAPVTPAPDPLVMIEKIANLLKTTAQPTTSFKDVLETLNEALDLKRELRADHDGGTGDPMLDIVKENLPNLIGVIQNAQRQSGQPVSSADAIAKRFTGTPAVPAGATTPALPAGETGTMDPQLLAFLNGRRKHWVQSAEAGRSAPVMAAYEWEMLPAQYRGPVREFMDDMEKAAQTLVKVLPEMAKFPTWYDDFFTELHVVMFPERYEGDDEGGDIVEENVVEVDADDRGGEGEVVN
jgi:hypothetical protein